VKTIGYNSEEGLVMQIKLVNSSITDFIRVLTKTWFALIIIRTGKLIAAASEDVGNARIGIALR